MIFKKDCKYRHESFRGPGLRTHHEARTSYYYTSLSLFKNLLPPGTQNSANFLIVMTAAPFSVLARHRWILKVVTEDV